MLIATPAVAPFVVTPLPATLTYGEGLAVLYALQHWESITQPPDGPYAPSFLLNQVGAVLRGLTNTEMKTFFRHVARGRCPGCDAPVDLATVERGDHIIAEHWGGRHGHGNFLDMCKPCNSSKNKKDLLAWWLFKGYPVSQLDRSVLCLYAREQWQHWGAQVHREPCYPWLRAFCEQRAAALPSAAHWEALVRASCAVCVEAQRPMVTQGYGNGKAPAHLSTYGQAMPWGGGL